MEIREFAERVLHSPSLTEKLAVPGRLTDDRPGVALSRVVLPQRPPEGPQGLI